MDGRREGVSHARDGDVRPGTDGKRHTHILAGNYRTSFFSGLLAALEGDAKVLNSV